MVSAPKDLSCQFVSPKDCVVRSTNQNEATTVRHDGKLMRVLLLRRLRTPKGVVNLRRNRMDWEHFGGRGGVSPFCFLLGYSDSEPLLHAKQKTSTDVWNVDY
jgi:hypothetical protein